MKCPHCGKKVLTPTHKQINAYIHMFLYMRSEAETAKRMKITQRHVRRLLHNLGKACPKLLPPVPKHKKARHQFDESQDSTPKQCF